jgi:hypothetical protein
MTHEIYLSPDDVVGPGADEQLSEIIWDSALIISEMVGAEPGSGEFIDIYQGLKDAFAGTEAHNKQAAFYALTLIQVMLQSGRVALVSKTDTIDSMRDSIIDISQMAYRTVMFVMAVSQPYGSVLVLDNEEFDNLPAEDTTFLFPIDSLEGTGHELSE